MLTQKDLLSFGLGGKVIAPVRTIRRDPLDPPDPH
jgi:hypothetical protein